MRQKQDQWRKPRSNGNHFTEDEINKVWAAYKANRAPKDIARELKCSSRSINRYYSMIREGRNFLCSKPRKVVPVIEVRRVPVDRFYHGSFDL